MNSDPRVNTTGLRTEQVLVALYNSAKAPRRMGVLQINSGPLLMDEVWAEGLIKSGEAFSPTHPSDRFVDYLHGRAIKVNLADKASFDPSQFDENNDSPGLAQRAIDHIRQTGELAMVPDCDARTWLRIVTDESLAIFDQGDKMDALANFLVGTARHPDTAHIPSASLTVPMLTTSAHQGREELQETMLGLVH